MENISGHIIHVFLHFVVGASLAYLFCGKAAASKVNRKVLFVFGGAAAISPDISKLYGDLLGHSIWLVPVIGLFFAACYYAFQRKITFKKAWLILSICVFSHLFIDFIGNGVAPFYPFIKTESDFFIVNRNDAVLLITLTTALIIGAFTRRRRRIFLSGLILVALYLGGLSFSKLQLQHALEKKYRNENIYVMLTFPREGFKWSFMVRTDETSVDGYSPIAGLDIHIEQEMNKSGEWINVDKQ